MTARVASTVERSASPRSARHVVPLALVAMAVAAGFLVHLPGLRHQLFDPDEAAIATMGTSLTHGGVLYRDVFDRKPPLRAVPLRRELHPHR